MPNRILRPWTDSEAVNALSDQAEVFFTRLIMCADDLGRFHGDPRLLKSYLYPLKDKRIADITRWSAECAKAGLIAEYEVQGKRYVEIRNFGQRTRIVKSRFPDPPEDAGRATVGQQSNDSQMTVKCQSKDSHMPARVGVGDENMEDSDKSSSSSPKRSRRISFGYESDHQLHGITDQDLAEWKRYYPALDIDQELRSASSWLAGNPRNRKSDILRFLTGWLQRAQQRAPRVEEVPQGTGSGRWHL